MDSIFKRAMESANYDPVKATGYVSSDILRRMASRLAEIGEPIDTPEKEAEAWNDVIHAREEYVKEEDNGQSNT